MKLFVIINQSSGSLRCLTGCTGDGIGGNDISFDFDGMRHLDRLIINSPMSGKRISWLLSEQLSYVFLLK